MDKDYILQEIRRTADENGGVPLGRQRFFYETGIREQDWSGRFWARWGDALREAGLTPNQLQAAYDADDLVERYVALIRRKGAVPTHAELQMERRADPTFPSANVFTRFGTKADLISKVLEYCVPRDGYDDVVQLCESYEPISRSLGSAELDPTGDIGFVYMTKVGRFYKIGRTNAAGRREREIALQLPEKASTVHVIRTDDPVGIEAYWHRRFEAKRKNGEWFALTAADVSAFKRRKFM